MDNASPLEVKSPPKISVTGPVFERRVEGPDVFDSSPIG